jgi:hypothetical protein
MNRDDLQQEFNSRITAIHATNGTSDKQPIDIRHEEFQTMADVFLGEDYDQDKLSQVENLQIELHQGRAELYKKLRTNELSPEEYVDSVNTLARDTFLLSENILGTQDFISLFGAPPSEMSGFIDKEMFLQTYTK